MRYLIILVTIILILPISANASNLVNGTFIDADIREVIYDISKQTGINIIIDNTVEGFVTLDFKDTPLDRALDMITAQSGYVYSKKDGYYLIGSQDTKSFSFNNLSTTYFYKPRYVSPDSIKQKLQDNVSTFIKVDNSLNILSITAPVSMIESIIKRIRDIDIRRKSIFVDVLYVKESYREIEKIIPETWKLESNLEGETDGTTGEVYFKDMKFGFMYSDNLSIDGVMNILKAKSDTLQTARSKFIVLEDERSDFLIEEETYRQLVIENYTTTVKFSSNIQTGIISRMSDDKINIDLELIASYIDGELRKSIGSTKTSILLQQGKIGILGGVVDYREMFERYGVFTPYIPTREKSEDSFTIFIYAKEIPEDLEKGLVNIIESSVYTSNKIRVKREEKKELNISGGPITVIDLNTSDIGKTTIKSGLDINGSFPINRNIATLDGVYLEDGLKSLRLNFSTLLIRDINTGISYRLARSDNLSIDSLNIFLENETHPSSSLTLNGKMFFLIMKDNMDGKTNADIGINLSANYKISSINSLKLEYFRTLDPSILSSLKVELETKLSKSLSFILGYDIRESLYQDNIISDSYGRGVYIKLDYNF